MFTKRKTEENMLLIAITRSLKECSAAPFSRFPFPHLFFPFSFYPILSFAISFPLSSIFLIIVYSFHLHRALSLSPNEELQPGPNHRYPGPGLRYLGLKVQRPSPSRRTSQTRNEVGTRQIRVRRRRGRLSANERSRNLGSLFLSLPRLFR